MEKNKLRLVCASLLVGLALFFLALYSAYKNWPPSMCLGALVISICSFGLWSYACFLVRHLRCYLIGALALWSAASFLVIFEFLQRQHTLLMITGSLIIILALIGLVEFMREIVFSLTRKLSLERD
ncbi:MAG: hypothetical protein QMC77_00335 [Methanocellales archaeon]|nr:hypothetical protein [Methanocellales archaeon]